MEGRSMGTARKRIAGRALRSVLAVMVVLAGALVLSGTAAAQETGSSSVNCELDPYNSVCEGGEKRNFGPEVESDVLTRPETSPDDSGETLPFTGADVTLFVITGAALVATGMLVVRRTRARRSEV